MAEDLGVWAYAVAGGLDQGLLAGLTGVGGEPVHTVEGAGLVGVVGTVDLGDCGRNGA